MNQTRQQNDETDRARRLYGDEGGAIPAMREMCCCPLRALRLRRLSGCPRTPAKDTLAYAARASFVTLTKQGDARLHRYIEAHRALGADVKANAVAAALRDPVQAAGGGTS